MPESKLNTKIKIMLNDFIAGLKNCCQDNLISVILYGSAASGEFVDKHSNLNVLVVLKDASLDKISAVSDFINKREFKEIHPLFFSEEYIKTSNDVFPIEFLDMKENYTVFFGLDILKDLYIDTKNLRFQCEQELKVKWIGLRQLYLTSGKNKNLLLKALFRYFTSIMHILRNVLRLKGKQPPYLKQDILKEISAEFPIDRDAWYKLSAAKNKQIKLSTGEIEQLSIALVNDLEKIIDAVNKL